MNYLRAWAVARKEFLHVLRDPRSLAMAIAMPMLLLLLFGYALTLDVDNVPIVVWDQSQTPASRELISRFRGSRYFSIKGYGWNYPGLEREIDSGNVLAALVVPRDFTNQIRSGRQASLQMIVDGSNSNTATLAVGYADSVTRAYSQELSLKEIRRAGGAVQDTPVDFRPRVWFNPELESRNYIIPGLIAVIMMVIAALLTSLTVAREWERGTMEQLISTPVTGRELIMGKLLPYFSIGLLDVLLAVLLGDLLFHVPLRGSVLLLFVSAAVFLAGSMALGVLISVIAKNQLMANQLAMVVTFLPSFLLSGFVYPISNMPTVIQWITNLVPARYFITLLKAIYLKGVGVPTLAGEGLLLVVYAGSTILLAVGIFKKKLV
ncbi:MAG: ABC transporter permease [Acidobacteria bacterium]|nr:MAG: ABC transporter permease [Acidobacteriota bacterium]